MILDSIIPVVVTHNLEDTDKSNGLGVRRN